MLSGKFTLVDVYQQIQQMQGMGSMDKIMEMIRQKYVEPVDKKKLMEGAVNDGDLEVDHRMVGEHAAFHRFLDTADDRRDGQVARIQRVVHARQYVLVALGEWRACYGKILSRTRYRRDEGFEDILHHRVQTFNWNFGIGHVRRLGLRLIASRGWRSKPVLGSGVIVGSLSGP